jgi:isoleucyl-tRNA synthetase
MSHISPANTSSKANPKIVEFMRERGVLLLREDYQQNYPHCWRCHNPVIFRATPQWFISMEATNLRERVIASTDSVEWVPSWGNVRMKNMFYGRPDWCISRQRSWGVPITVFYCTGCEEALCKIEVIEHVARIFEQESADAWYIREAKDLLPEGTKCEKCSGTEFRKEMDILDVWIDSGTSSIAVLEPRGLPYPADAYLEGGDQFRGWFNSSLVVGLETKDQPPYRSVITYGWVVDVEGRQDVQIKGQRLRTANDHQTERCGNPAAVVFGAQLFRGHARLGGDPAAHLRCLSQAPQHGALLPRQPRRLRPGDGSRVVRGDG